MYWCIRHDATLLETFLALRRAGTSSANFCEHSHGAVEYWPTTLRDDTYFRLQQQIFVFAPLPKTARQNASPSVYSIMSVPYMSAIAVAMNRRRALSEALEPQ